MSTPLGRNVGNALEVKEVIDFFNLKYDKRLYELSVYISSLMISTAKKISFRKAKSLVINLIESGHAKINFMSGLNLNMVTLIKLKIRLKNMWLCQISLVM